MIQTSLPTVGGSNANGQRTSRNPPSSSKEVNHFINKAVEITTEPIFDHRGVSPYSLHEGEPWIYC